MRVSKFRPTGHIGSRAPHLSDRINSRVTNTGESGIGSCNTAASATPVSTTVNTCRCLAVLERHKLKYFGRLRVTGAVVAKIIFFSCDSRFLSYGYRCLLARWLRLVCDSGVRYPRTPQGNNGRLDGRTLRHQHSRGASPRQRARERLETTVPTFARVVTGGGEGGWDSLLGRTSRIRCMLQCPVCCCS